MGISKDVKRIGGIDANLLIVLSITIMCYAALSSFFYFVIEFNTFVSDVQGYWKNSLNWRLPFDSHHVPGFSFLITLARGVAPENTSPVFLMSSVIFLAFIGSTVLTFEILRGAHLGNRTVVFGTLLFNVWPFFGLTYVVYPIADTLAMCLLLAVILAFQRDRDIWGWIAVGALLMVHKAFWPFLAAVVLAAMLQPGRKLALRDVAGCVLAFVPLATLWLVGASLLGYDWIIRSNMESEFISESGSLLFGGVTSSITGVFDPSVGAAKSLKGVAVLIVMALAIFTIYNAVAKRHIWWRYTLALSGTVLLWCVLLNAYEILAVVRFSPLLALPLLWGIGGWLESNLLTTRVGLSLAGVTIFSAYASQFAYSVIMMKKMVSLGF